MSNILHFSQRAAVKQEAAEWLVRLDKGAISKQESDDFKEWLARSDFHQRYLLELAACWDSMAVLKELSEIFPFISQRPVTGKVSRRSAKKNIWNRFAMACSAGLVLLAVATVYFFSSTQKFVTNVGQQAAYTLNDGTVIFLNTDSQVEVTYSREERVVNLLQGEVSFDVVKNPVRPFVVYAGNGVVQAVGTVFNVKYIRNAVDVIVTEGRVKVYGEVTKNVPQSLPNFNIAEKITTVSDQTKGQNASAKKEIFLDPGESLRYSDKIDRVELDLKKDVMLRKLAWQKGAIIFQGETLQDALLEISRYTDKELVIVDPVISQTRIGGHYKTDDINALLTALSLGFGIKVEQVSDGQIQLSAR
jgi:transmembrane sensor